VAVFIPFDEGYLGVAVADEPDPESVCPGDCRICITEGDYCLRELRRLEVWAEAELVSEVLFGTRN
jgi:hypothetical protein